MCNIKSIKYIGKEPVYNMSVSKEHNYLIKGNVVSKNCDSLRYFCVFWTLPANPLIKSKRSKWTEDMIEDYRNANAKDREYLVKLYGEPI